MANDEEVSTDVQARRVFADMAARYRHYVDAAEAEGDGGERPSQAQLYQDIMALAAFAEMWFEVHSGPKSAPAQTVFPMMPIIL
jgi:hypothetical protein